MPQQPALRKWLRPALLLGAIVIAMVAFTAFRDHGSAPPAFEVGSVSDAPAVIGQPAPDFALETLDGEVAHLSDYRGQTVILNFWATWCLPCYLEMPEFQALYEERAAQGDFVVLAVNITPQDSRQRAADFAEDIGLTFPVLLETDALAVAEGYELDGLPGTFFIDRDGILRDVSYGIMAGEALTDRVAATDAFTR